MSTPIVKSQNGITIIELMVSVLLLSVTLMMLIGYVMSMQNAFFNDVVRTRINGNLRTALDIVSMNVRQAGENLGTTFPAVVIQADDDTVGSKLILRRNKLSEVLTVCEAAAAGDTRIFISTTTTPSPACVYANVTGMYNAYSAEKTAENGTLKIYIYNSLTRIGEYIDYTGEGTESTGVTAKYYLTVSALPAAYGANTSYIYYIEEYDFALDEQTNTLNLTRNGDSLTIEPVAFSISNFLPTVRMQDGTILTSLPYNAVKTWKDMDYISVSLTGTESRKSRNYSTSISGNYYPRNVLSR